MCPNTILRWKRSLLNTRYEGGWKIAWHVVFSPLNWINKNIHNGKGHKQFIFSKSGELKSKCGWRVADISQTIAQPGTSSTAEGGTGWKDGSSRHNLEDRTVYRNWWKRAERVASAGALRLAPDRRFNSDRKTWKGMGRFHGTESIVWTNCRSPGWYAALSSCEWCRNHEGDTRTASASVCESSGFSTLPRDFPLGQKPL